jgi:uncharacterized RDD family membrane protein YckC
VRSLAERLEQARPASFGRRVPAFLIDLLAITVVAFVIVLPIQAALGQEQQNDALGGVYVLIIAAIFVGYEWISGLTGATLGMRAFGMRIIRADGAAVNGMPALLRGVVLFFGGLIALGPFSGLWHKEGRAWHDLASGTGVVRL